MLEPAWVRAHEFDLMHLHFGFDHRSPDQLRELVAALRSSRRPLVLTVHDLRSPHQEDPAVLAAQLDVLVPAADALLTLTSTAADEIERRWARTAQVVAHPHLVDPTVIDATRRRRALERTSPSATRPARVGVALKSLRRNTDGARLLPALAALTARGHHVAVTLHAGVLESRDPELQRSVVALQRAHARGEVELVLHEPLDDARLWSWVADLDVAVLPYRFGTHSGWLEMCHDLATSVVAPASGHYVAQGADAAYEADAQGVDDASLVAAVERALAQRRTALPGLDVDERLAQRREVAAAHDRVYAAVLASLRGAA